MRIQSSELREGKETTPSAATTRAIRLSTPNSPLSTFLVPAFTLIEALVSIAIAAGLILMLATIFRQTSALQRQASAGARASQVARTVYDMIGRDLMGLSREGALMVRCQAADGRYDDRDHIIVGFDGEGDPIRLDGARTDMLVMLTSGYETSATNNERVSNFARVIWSQTERINGVDLDANIGGHTDEAYLREHPKFWGANQVLSRHQTLCIPDPLSSDSSWSSYKADLPGSSWSAKKAYNNRGPDYYNLSLNDVTRWFDDAMVGSDKYGYAAISPFLFGTTWASWMNELQSPRYASKITRVGRDGSNEDGQISESDADRKGGGDLTRHMVDSDEEISPSEVHFSSWPLELTDKTCIAYHGYERPRVYGPEDYHRIAAFGVAAFQVDWADGRYQTVDGERQWAFYPTDGCRPQNSNLGASGSYNLLGGPGPTQTYAWNYYSPTTVRESLVLKPGRGGICHYDPERTEYGQWVYWAWRLDTAGAFPYGIDAWCWPKALRVRIVLVRMDADQCIPFVFERVFYLNVQ